MNTDTGHSDCRSARTSLLVQLACTGSHPVHQDFHGELKPNLDPIEERNAVWQAIDVFSLGSAPVSCFATTRSPARHKRASV